MIGKWTAEITNDPDHDQRLYIELLEDDKYRGRIYRDETGDLVMRIYVPTVIPLQWLLEIAEEAKQDLQC